MQRFHAPIFALGDDPWWFHAPLTSVKMTLNALEALIYVKKLFGPFGLGGGVLETLRAFLGSKNAVFSLFLSIYT